MDFLGRIRKLDSSLQRGLDNSFARVFGGKVVPNELEECLKQEIEDFLMQDAEGRYLAPNYFRIGVSQKDFANLSAAGPELPSELADRMGRYCRNNGWSMSGSVSVRIQQVDALHTGQLKTASQFTEGFRDESGFFGDDGEAIAAGTRPSPRDDGPSTDSAAPQSPAASEQFGGVGAGELMGGSSDTEARYRDRDDEPAPEIGTGGNVGAGVGAGTSQSSPLPTRDRPVQVPPGPSSPEDEQLTVTLLLQDGSNRTFEVKPGSNIIGRGTISDFRLPDTGVSRQHAEITWDGRDAVLVDLHSTNGTMVNDSPIDNWLLADGDVMSMGHSVMEVRIR